MAKQLNLSEAQILRVELEVGQRSAVAGFFHIVAILVIWLLIPVPKPLPPIVHWIGVALVAVMVSRWILARAQKNHFSDPAWRKRWKLWFRIVILLSAILWGLLSAAFLWRYGLSVPFFVITIVNVGVAAISVQNLGLDLVLVRFFVPMIVGIPSLALLLLHDEGHIPFAAMMLLFLGYLLFLARRAHKLLWEAMENRTELEEARAKAIESARLASLGTMAGGIAHEINNPLQVIRSLSQLLKNPPPLAKENQQEIATRIDETAERIARIIAGLRAFARPGVTDRFEFVDISELLGGIAELAKVSRPSGEIKLEIAAAPPGLKIECRRTEIGQVLINLINNAFDAVENLRERWVRIKVIDLGEMIEIRVVDSGHGIPEDILDKIFVPFFTTKPPSRGIGLGISISASIVQTHHGRLWIDRTSPNTCFVVSLPKRQES